MRTDGLFLAGIGVELAGREKATDSTGGWTGVAVAGHTPAPDLAVAAGRRALAQSGHIPAEIGMVIHATVGHHGPDGWPSASYVQRHTIGGNGFAFQVHGSCTGMLTAIELAHSWLITAGATAALLTGADNFGHPLVDRWRYAEHANLGRPTILGDAGTAVVLSRRTGFARVLAAGSSALPEYEEMYRHRGPLFPPDCTVGRKAAVGQRIVSYVERNPRAFGAFGPALTAARTELAEQTMKEGGVSAAEITRVTHVFSGVKTYVAGILEPLGIDPARGVLEFGRDLGHLSVNDHVAALNHLLDTDQVVPGDHVLMLGNGSGVSLACALIRIEQAPTSG